MRRPFPGCRVYSSAAGGWDRRNTPDDYLTNQRVSIHWTIYWTNWPGCWMSALMSGWGPHQSTGTPDQTDWETSAKAPATDHTADWHLCWGRAAI